MESGGNVELGAYQDNNSGQTRISIHDCPLSKSTCKLLNRVVPNGTLRGVEGEVKISPIRLSNTNRQILICRKKLYSFIQIYATLYKKPRKILIVDFRSRWRLGRMGMTFFAIMVSKSGDVVFPR